MEYFWGFVVDLVLCGLVGMYAERKGYRFSRGFFFSLLLSPLIGFLIMGFSTKKN
jgi:hypothetical protein